ncbi:MAG: hypothetical protein H8D38_01835 [DPANN group archaeon]|nr:hypothetical protein [DPANN group archaeon]
MMRKIFFSVLVLFLIVLTSCGPKQNPYIVDYYTGTKGLELEFLGDSPPDEIYENTEFPLAVFVSNEGAFSLNGSPYKGLISYSYDSFYLSPILGTAQEEVLDIMLEGKSYTYPEGDFETFILPGFRANSIVGQRENPLTDLFVTACYPYRTKLTDEICIDTSAITRDIREKVCTSEIKGYNGQGAPVAITEVKPEMQTFGNRIRPVFLITIQNRGSGSVLSPVDKSEIERACEVQTDSSRKKNWNKVLVRAQLSGEELTCVPDEITLREQKGFARCYLSSEGYGSSLNYLATLIVELDYVYLSSVSKTVSIVRSNIPDLEPLSSGNCDYWQTEIKGVCKNNCELCSEGARFAFCSSIYANTNWTCGCGVEDCVTTLANKKLKKLTDQIEFKASDCIFTYNLCEPEKFCCAKQ